MYEHYTNIAVIRNDIGIRIRDPKTKMSTYYKIPFRPRTYTTCLPSYATETWKTIDGQPLRERTHASIGVYENYLRQSAEENFPVYGAISPVNQFMAYHVPESCGVPFPSLRTVYLDIEVGSSGGFAPPDNPYQPIVAITAYVWGTYHVWGCGEYTPANDTVLYVRCENEADLLMKFIKWWCHDYPDVVTGWNIDGYDIPYILNRVGRLVDEGAITHSKIRREIFSPWGKLSHRHVTMMGRETTVTEIVGVATLDYLELYRRFAGVQRESYRLDAIAEIELGRKKVAYDEYGSLQRLAEENYQKFVDYNITDVELVMRLNEKLHHLDLAVQIAYAARVNYVDIHKQVRLWDAMMYYNLFDRKIAVPPKARADKAVNFTGAYVKDPQVGKHHWVVSFDINSLYPSIMRQWNISPDRHLSIEWLQTRLSEISLLSAAERASDPPSYEECTPREWITSVNDADVSIVRWALEELIAYLGRTSMEQMFQDLDTNADWRWLRVLNVCITPNGQTFRCDDEGFLTGMLSRLYSERKYAKEQETLAKKKAASASSPEEKSQYEQEALLWGLQQNTRKINLNSCYGSLGSEYHRFFDVRHAEAVTAMGQVIIQHVARRVNEFLNREFETQTDYILASDTDSIYVTVGPLVKNLPASRLVDIVDAFCQEKIQPVIDAAFVELHRRFNTRENVLAMKREAIAEHGVWTAKKRYLLWVHDQEGVRFAVPKLKITGIEAVRSSTPKYARTVIKTAMEYFIQDNKSAFYQLLEDAEEEFMSRPFEDIASPRSVNGMDDYDPGTGNGGFLPKTPIHVKGAFTFNRHLAKTGLTDRYPMIRNNEKIRFCYLKPQNPLNATVIAAPHRLPPEWKLEPYLDRHLQFEKSVLSPLEPIIRTVGWSVRPVVTLD